MRWLGLLVAASVLVLPGEVRGTVDDPSITIPVAVTVTDDQGVPVLGLSSERFEVLTDGRPAAMTAFVPPGRSVSAALVLGTGAAVRGGLGSVREGAQAFVGGLSDRDRAIVCAYGSDLLCDHAFATNRAELWNRIEHIQYLHGTRVFDAIDAAIMNLSEAEGRRVIVALTARFDTQSAVKPAAVLAHARQSDVMVYVIGVDERYYDGDEFITGRPDPDLQQLVRETGGRYFERESWDDVPSAFAALTHELHSQYTLNVRASVPDTRVHSIKVRLNGAHLHIRARRTFQVSTR